MKNLIERFKEASNTTIWSLLEQLSTESDVFSMHPAQLTPQLEGPCYVYGQDMDLVIVYLDKHADGQSVLADEERFADEDPLYFTESSHWTSPVYLLQLASHAIRQVLRRLKMRQPTIHCVCVTNTYIINKEDMTEVWEWLNVTMIDMATVRREAKVANNMQSMGGLMLSSYLEHKEMARWELDPDYDHVVENNPVAPKSDGRAVPCDADLDDEELPEEIPVDLPSADNLRGVQIINPVRHPERLLSRLTGLTEVRHRISDIALFSQYNNQIRALGGKAHPISLHSVFYGNPGTGKTTVGRIFASMLLKAGVLSKGHLVLVNGRQAFVGRFFGDEEAVVEKLIRLSKGGILFIDEAYTLMGNHHEDPGRLILPMLMQLMADETNRDVAVVLAGYQQPLEELLALNDGLASRFARANRICFPDYPPEDLFQIALMKMEEYGYAATEAAKGELMAIIAHDYAHRNPRSFGNGRYVVNRMDEVFLHHGIRCISENLTTPEQGLYRIELADVAPLRMKKDAFEVRTKNRIGFTT